ncbi:MAG: 2Fe-2S iron-sulfur cluster-binding protein [Desulfobacterales bacterium]
MPGIVLNGQRLQGAGRQAASGNCERRRDSRPSLCYHPALSPAGVCQQCAVEVKLPGKDARIRLSCALRVKEGMEIRTDSAAVSDARLRISAAGAVCARIKIIRSMAAEYGIDLGPAPDECIRCRLLLGCARRLSVPGPCDEKSRRCEHDHCPRKETGASDAAPASISVPPAQIKLRMKDFFAPSLSGMR